MRIRILGGHGGVALGLQTTSFLIDDVLLIDAGAVASVLRIEEQIAIQHILISHSHLDHVKDLAFLCDNCFGLRPNPFEVYSSELVRKIIKEHIFNETIWPDFSKLPNATKPTVRFHALPPEQKKMLGDYTVTPIPVQHPNEAMGFIVEKGDSCVLFTVDTGPTEKIWEWARKEKNLKAIFTEVSFPNHMQKVATLSDHHTPQSLGIEIEKMPKDIPIILTHLKPNYRAELKKEVAALQNSRLIILEADGMIFDF